MLKNLSSLLTYWSSHEILWLSRIVAVKVTLLPTILYSFRVLLVTVSVHYLRILQRWVSSFIWAQTHPWVPKSTVHRPRSAEGLGLLSFSHYYQPSRLILITKYHATYPQLHRNLTVHFQLPHTELFRYLQVKNVLLHHRHFPSYGFSHS